MELSNLTWKEAEARAKKNSVVIMTTDSAKQHGPHLPLKMDIGSADYIARKMAESTSMLATPALNFGYSELWRHYPRTISLRPETFQPGLYYIIYATT
jgi:creatinine amidohydrolase